MRATAGPEVAAPGTGPRHGPLRTWAVLAGVTGACSAVIVAWALAGTDGRLTYAIDDAGIHLSMAHHLVRDGTWGVSAGTFEPASSSPAWTLLLAAATWLAGGVAAWWPLLGNLAAAGWVCRLVARHQRVLHLGGRTWGAWAAALVLPWAAFHLPGLAVIGMEHTLQAALWLVALVHLDRCCGTDPDRAVPPGAGPSRDGWVVAGALAAASPVRYETVFLTLGCVLALWACGRSTPGTGTARAGRAVWSVRWLAASAVPIVAMGVVNVAFGRSPFPNPILRKSGLGADRGLLPGPGALWERMSGDVLCSLVVIGATVWAWRAWRARRAEVPSGAYATALAAAGWGQLILANVGWWSRYQAAVVIAGVLLALRVLPAVVPGGLRQPALAGLAALVVATSAVRVHQTRDAALAMRNTYRQQVQVGRFLAEAYRGRAVGVTDLGYTSLQHDGPIVDLEGLGTREVLRARRAGRFDRSFLERLLAERDVELLAIYDLPYLRIFPRGWAAVGTWDHGLRNVTPLYRRVAFFAPEGAAADRADRALRAFARRLPPGVVFRDRERILTDHLAQLERRRARASRTDRTGRTDRTVP